MGFCEKYFRIKYVVIRANITIHAKILITKVYKSDFMTLNVPNIMNIMDKNEANILDIVIASDGVDEFSFNITMQRMNSIKKAMISIIFDI